MGRWNCFILLDSVASCLNDQRGARVKNIKWKTQIKRKRDFELNTLEDSVFALDVLFQKNSERGPVKVVKCQLARFTQFKKKKKLHWQSDPSGQTLFPAALKTVCSKLTFWRESAEGPEARGPTLGMG